MADFEPFAGLASEEVVQGILAALQRIAAAQPRLDANGRAQVSWAEVAHNIATVTTLTTAQSLVGLGGLARDASAMPIHMGNAGAQHLYNQITVT